MPNPGHNPTDGLQSAAFVQVSGGSGNSVITANKTVGANKPNPGNYSVTLSLSAAGGMTTTVQIAVVLADVANGPQMQSMVLTSVASGTGVYTGTITGGAANAFAGQMMTVAGFVTAANNGTFLCTASTATTVTLVNAASVAETHAGTVSAYVGTILYKSYNNPNAGTPAWYKPSAFAGYSGDVASVSGSGLITALALGQAVVEVSAPAFDNSQAAMGGLAGGAIYTQIVVNVVP